MTTIQKVRKVCKWLIFRDYADNDAELAKKLGYTKSSFSQILNEKVPLSEKFIDKLCNVDSNINKVWILHDREEMFKEKKVNDSGKGEMLMRRNAIESIPQKPKRNMIPLYEDVSTIGGMQQTANIETTYNNSVQIDAGSWFNGATAAIRHYGDSMIEYESGCTLVIRELKDNTEIIWGRNYVVETDEMRITKKIANLDDEHIMCYSTNYDTYPDGTLIHQPIKIKKKNIRQLSRVLGSVNKEESTGKVSLIEL